ETTSQNIFSIWRLDNDAGIGVIEGRNISSATNNCYQTTAKYGYSYILDEGGCDTTGPSYTTTAAEKTMFNSTSNFTIAMWDKIQRTANNGNTDNLLYAGIDNGNGAGGYAYINIPFGADTWNIICSNGSTTATGPDIDMTGVYGGNVWRHGALTYQKLANNTPLVKFYRDGTLKSTYDCGAMYMPNVDTSSFFFGDGFQPLNGSIDDLAVWNSTLSAAQIYTIYNTSLTAGTYYWKVNVSDGGSTTESSQVKFLIGTDTTKPNVTDARPTLSSDYNLSQTIEIAANATDDWALDTVWVNITLPNASINSVTLTATGIGQKFNNTYTTPSLRGLYNVTFYANDTSNNLNNSITTNFTADASPGITISSPANNSGSTTGNITFNYNATDFNSISNCSLLINGAINITNTTITKEVTQNFTTTNLPAGGYNVSVNCTDSLSNTGTVAAIGLSVFRKSTFSGTTTNFDNIDCSAVSRPVFEDSNYGIMNFTVTVNLCSGGDFNTYINISSNKIFLNSSVLSTLNTTAILKLYNLTFSNPQILRDNASCSTNICTRESYTAGVLTFNVTSFSTYSAAETISDSTTSSKKEEIDPSVGGEIDVPEELINSGATFQPGVSRRIALSKLK
ncbi:MAG: LamG-like jellyroll fold domain-containing protein, partial [Nanoarchaeota archaeon]